MVRAFEEIYDVYLEREVYVQKLGLKIYIYTTWIKREKGKEW